MSTNTISSHHGSDCPSRANSTTIPSHPRQRVHHTYRDVSLFVESGGRLPKQKKSGTNFPSKLQRMLSDEKYSQMITWMPHGRAWKILDKRLLLSTAIPAYFGQTRFESFTRQLSNWGFRRLHRSGPDLGCYYHQCFLRGLPQLTKLMERVRREKLAPHAEGEPNFYLISDSHPLSPPALPSGGLSRSMAPVTNLPVPMVAASASASIPSQEMEHGDDTKQNRTMLQPQFYSSEVTSTAAALSSNTLYQIQNKVQCAPASTWAHGVPMPLFGANTAHHLVHVQPIMVSSTTEQRLTQGEDRVGSGSGSMDRNLFDDDDYLRFINILIERS